MAPFRSQTAIRARSCASRKSLSKKKVSSTKFRSAPLSERTFLGRSVKDSGIAAPATSFTSGGCSGLRRKSLVRRYSTPAVMCHGSSTVSESSWVPTADRAVARSTRASSTT